MNTPLLSEALHRLMHAYKKQLREGMEKKDISLPVTQIRALKGICRRPDITAQQIAQRLRQDKAQVTRALNGLIESGLIEKTANPNDGRSHNLKPTSAGKRLLAKFDRIEVQASARMTRNLSAKDLKTFIRIANVMTDNSAGTTSAKGARTDG